MGAWSNFLSWLRNTETSDSYYLESGSLTASSADSKLNLKLIMMASALGYLAAGLNLCRWRTIIEGKDVQKREYFRLNNCPNPNQNKAEFCAKLMYQLGFFNEALIISPTADGSLYVADSFDVEERGTRENLYRNVIIENDGRSYSFTAGEVMHLKLNWTGLYPLIAEAAEEYESMITTAVTGYEKQAGERGTLEISGIPSGTKEQQAAYIKTIEERFKKYYSATNAVLPLQSGFKYSMNSSAHRNTSEINDVINLSDEFAERLALAVRVPVALLKGNVENTTHAREDLVLYGVNPIARMIEQEYNTKRLGMEKMMRGSRLKIDPISIHLSDMDSLATFCERMTSCGQYSVDELRDLRDETLLGTPEAQVHYITKNYGFLGSSDDSTVGDEAAEAADLADAPEETDDTAEEKE